MRGFRPQDARHNISDQLRGVRHLVRAIGQETSKAALKQDMAPPLVGRLLALGLTGVGSVITQIDETMIDLQAITQPPAAALGPISRYFPKDGSPRSTIFVADLYEILKQVAGTVAPNQYIVKSPLEEVYDRLKPAMNRASATESGDIDARFSANLYHVLATTPVIRQTPLVSMDDAQMTRQLAATSLLFALGSQRGLTHDEVYEHLDDALLAAAARLDVYREAGGGAGPSEAFVKTVSMLLAHIG